MSLEKFTKVLSKWKKASEDNEKITRKLLEFYKGQSEKGRYYLQYAKVLQAEDFHIEEQIFIEG